MPTFAHSDTSLLNYNNYNSNSNISKEIIILCSNYVNPEQHVT